jgi:ribosomal protein S18 acetylase RimI-like enzyme
VADVAALAAVTYRAAFGHSFTPADLAAQVAGALGPARFAQYIDEDIVLLAEWGAQLVGYVQFGAAGAQFPAAAPGDQELRRLYVHPAEQNRGAGTRLLEAALAHPHMTAARTVLLDVWERNLGAIRLYERFGFTVVGTRRFTVASGAPADLDLIMARVQSP